MTSCITCLTFSCSNKNCDVNADLFHVGSPGYPNLSKTPVIGVEGSTRNFEDKLSSYRCTPE